MGNNILVTVPKLTLPGGVSAFWNALLPEFSKMEKLNVHTLEIGGHSKNVFGPAIDQWKFNQELKTRPDLVVLNPSLGSRSFFRDAFFAKRLAKKEIPFALFFHGWNLQFQEKVDKKYVGFFQRTMGKAKIIFVLSGDFKDKLIAWGYTGEIRIATTMVDGKLFDNKEENEIHRSSESQLQILFLSRLLKEKGIYETIDAFQNLKLKYPEVQLIIAGDGAEYNRLNQIYGSNDSILLKGHVQGRQKIQLFKECDIYCLPSYSEGLPTSVLEAMAFGKPIVTTRVGGLKDFFQDGKMGLFVSSNDAKDLELKLNELMDNCELRKRMGEYNFNYAHKQLISSKVALKLADDLLQLI
ncbi:MAG: glycosyltransferase family 4 protein [Maribacter sp.]